MIVRLAVLVLLSVAVGGASVAYRRRRTADEARGAFDATTGDALWPALPADLQGELRPTWLVLSTPVCASCRAVQAAVADAFPHHRVLKVDVTERPELGDRYDVKRAPTTIVADATGTVVERLVGAEAVVSFIGLVDDPVAAR
ncbi:MAG: thioredoxin family protein [Acidimicrobiales bacterium]